jgi:hypothetical protein
MAMVSLLFFATYLKPADMALGAGCMNSGCAAGSERPAASIAACAVWVRNRLTGTAAVRPAAIADLTPMVKKSLRFINIPPDLLLLVLIYPTNVKDLFYKVNYYTISIFISR